MKTLLFIGIALVMGCCPADKSANWAVGDCLRFNGYYKYQVVQVGHYGVSGLSEDHDTPHTFTWQELKGTERIDCFSTFDSKDKK